MNSMETSCVKAYEIADLLPRIAAKLGPPAWQMHPYRNKHWIVVSGVAKVVNGERDILANTNESTYIPAGYQHGLEKPGMLDLVMIGVQRAESLGEEDLIRFGDRYGRI